MDTINIDLIKDDFLKLFDRDGIRLLIETLTKDTQSKFNSNLTAKQVEDLMLDLKAINKLSTLFISWSNDSN